MSALVPGGEVIEFKLNIKPSERVNESRKGQGLGSNSVAPRTMVRGPDRP